VANELAPDNARFAYVYAVALHDTGRAQGALQVLAAALKRDPYDRDVLSGLAYFTAQAGNREGALGYVKQLRELDPENPQYAQMAKHIGGAALYSITRSARSRVADETVTPSALAVFMLITKSNIVGRSTGMSAGLAPLRILSTKTGARR